MKYNQLRAMLSITKASLHSIVRNPSAVVFNLVFPLIFIIVFGFISGSGFKIDVAVDKNSDMNNPVINSLQKVNTLKLITGKPSDEFYSELEKGNIDAIILLSKTENGVLVINLKTTKASPERGSIFKMMLNEIIDKQNLAMNKSDIPMTELKEEVVEGRKYRTIDFILPGQLGFSLLSAGVFGTAFIFISLRQTLVIKRFFATPINKAHIILGESLSRLIFSMFSSVIIILIGTFFFGFTLVNGFVTFVNMIFLSIIALIVFLGFGFVVSGIAKNENAVPPIANLITLPQFLLAGTFFPISNFPEWLQPVSRALPLTYLNEAMRKISFEGASLFDVRYNILILVIWGIIVYAIAVKVFKWE
ncbi:MAG TPA: ABC transporter permease [Ignavibacteria bacterium]|nr:ABC transporter permease [Ignavibacteria bacterium]